MRKILTFLFIIQTASNENRKPKLGKGYLEAHRLNPYNPLSYIFAVLTFIVGIVMFGIIGFWKQIDGNPFKWN